MAQWKREVSLHPLVVKHLLLPAHEIVLRRGTLSYLRMLERAQWQSTDQLRALQQNKLRRLLIHASAKIPWHRRRIQQAGLNPETVTLKDLPALPTLTKADIRENAADMVDVAIPGGLMDYSTGGSTGEPLLFKIDRNRQAADQAARARSRRWFDIDLGQRELYLWGSPIELTTQDRLKRIRDSLTNHRLLDAFHMTGQSMSNYLDVIRRFDPVHLFGYPSSIAKLARFARDCGRDVGNRSLKAVFTTGELLCPRDRAIIEELTSVPVADGYGSREAGFIAHQCPHGRYHVTMESLIVELLDGDEHGGEVTVTHLDALGMPFIRYRTGDLARWSSSGCPCGRGLETLEIIQGRRTDLLRTTDGGHAHALSVIYVLRDEPTIRRFKVIQRPNLDLDVLLVATDAFDPACEERIGRLLRSRIGQTIAVRLHRVGVIPSDASGKYRYVVCE